MPDPGPFRAGGSVEAHRCVITPVYSLLVEGVTRCILQGTQCVLGTNAVAASSTVALLTTLTSAWTSPEVEHALGNKNHATKCAHHHHHDAASGSG
eukprot:3365547-Rhodomonas_salina.1